MSQDQRPPRVRLTSTTGSDGADRRRSDTAAAPVPIAAQGAAAPAQRLKLDWSVVLLFGIASIGGGVLTALFDLPALLPL